MGEVTIKSLHCYNKGCGKTFDPDDNQEDNCIYHTGEPYFHDAYKEWTCCHRKSTVFTEFLNFKGCTSGKHNGTKPIVLEKPKIVDETLMQSIGDSFSQTFIGKIVKDEEIPLDTPLIEMVPTISPRLLQQLSSYKTNDENEAVCSEPAIGAPCMNTSCSKTFGQCDDECYYHPGTAVFHEGLKYWSCCKKITTDFSKFLDQAGCTKGTHVWTKKKEPISCRLDWHQTATKVEVAIYAKRYDPYKSKISLSPVRLKVYIYFPEEEQVFEQLYDLDGNVKVNESKVSMAPTKVEVQLVKANAKNWSNLYK